MSPLFARGAAADHDRARELAAARLDEALPAGDVAWLGRHLRACPDCNSIAAEYAEQHAFFSSTRLDVPEPPRDLWARTAAALEAEGARGSWRSGVGRRRVMPLAPVAALMVVAIAVGAGLLNGSRLFPGGPDDGGLPMPTPINVAATEVRVVSRDEDGKIRILTRRVDQVCPMGAQACGITPSFDVTTTASIAGSADFDAISSPSRDRIVVVERGAGATGVYVLDMGATSPAPTRSGAPAKTSDPGGSAAPATQDPGTPSGSPDGATSAPSSDAPSSTPPSDDPATPDPSATPDATPSATPAVSARPTQPGPTPTVAVSPAENGALEIARDVTVVGSIAAYAPDGSMFAFTARPADGSVGPDVYVWTVGDGGARRVTADHASVFSGWLGKRLLVSRVEDGEPGTFAMNVAAGTETAIGGGQTWRPAVGPGHRTAVWWDGTVKLANDGVTPVPAAGRLVLAPWPAGSGSGKPQVLHTGSLADWDVHWDEDGSVVAVWTVAKDPAGVGSLSLYTIDGTTGRANLDHPLLDGAPAFAGFSLESGRLVWSAPKDGGDTTVQVLAWSGDSVGGRVELPSKHGTTVVH